MIILPLVSICPTILFSKHYPPLSPSGSFATRNWSMTCSYPLLSFKDRFRRWWVNGLRQWAVLSFSTCVTSHLHPVLVTFNPFSRYSRRLLDVARLISCWCTLRLKHRNTSAPAVIETVVPPLAPFWRRMLSPWPSLPAANKLKYVHTTPCPSEVLDIAISFPDGRPLHCFWTQSVFKFHMTSWIMIQKTWRSLWCSIIHPPAVYY